ncbi:DNA recombination protein RmuC [Candidatus Microgenomates bacterium]|nr:DNA recombination protein RmuC [Candidatus Microgenomates bacterium]
METTLLIIAIAVMVVGFGAVLGALLKRRDDTSLGLIKQDLQGLQEHMNQRLDRAAQVFTGLQSELGKMQELGRSLRDIQDVLKSPKLRGNIGEQLMDNLIRQRIPKGNYEMQHAFRSGEKVDAVIKTKSGLIPIDAKFPNENYIKYTQSKDEAEKPRLFREFQSDVKKHIDAISRKYILPDEGTVDFAFMYVPGEAVYYEIMVNTELVDYGSGKRVYLVSPQSFYYFLGTVLLSLEGEMIEARAKEVMNYLRSIQGDARRFGEDLTLVDKHLTNAKNASDKANKSYARLSGKIESATAIGTRDSEKLPAVEPEEIVQVASTEENQE